MDTISPPTDGPQPTDADTGQPQKTAVVKKEESPDDDDCILMSVAPCPGKEKSKVVICLDSDVEEDHIKKEPEASGQQTTTVGMAPRPIKQESEDDKGALKAALLRENAMTTESVLDTIVVAPEADDSDDAETVVEDNEDSENIAEEKGDEDYILSEDSDDDKDDRAQAQNVVRQKKVRKLEAEQLELLVKQNEGEELDSDERERLKELKEELKKTRIAIQKFLDSRKSFAKTAREFWQRQLRQELEEEARKRKRDEEEQGSNKVQKTAGKTNPGGSSGQDAPNAVASLFTINNTQDADINDSAPSMDEIEATTHASQMRQILAGMPEDGDTRHTASQKKDLITAKRCFGYKKVKAVNGRWKLNGLKTPLTSGQIVGASWLVRREAMDLHPAGGILADEMGVGKTLTSLAAIVAHPPEKEDIAKFCKATLIIADGPHSAESTWLEQINEHCEDRIAEMSMIYSKSLGKDPGWWSKRQVVITHIDHLRSQYPSKAQQKLLRGQWAGDDDGYQRALFRKLGPLLKIKWYRVVLDEAHSIKNHRSSNTFAAWQIQAKYRWALTGTPLTNKLEEFYPYLKFIGCDFATSMRKFRNEYVKSEDASENFATLASIVMLRRKQTDKFMGRIMVPLPKSHRSDLWVPLSGWEEIIRQVVDSTYEKKLTDEQVEKRKWSEANGNQDAQTSKDGHESDEGSEAGIEEDEGGTNFRVQNTRSFRLAQLTSHPLNLEVFFREKDREKDIRPILDRFTSELSSTTNRKDRWALKDALGETYLPGLQQLEAAIKNTFGGAKDMAKLLDMALKEQTLKDVTCPICDASPPTNPVQCLNCEHIYCDRCLTSTIGKPKDKRRLVCRHTGCSKKMVRGERIITPDCVDDAVKGLKGFKEAGRDSIGTKWHGHKNERFSFFRATSGRKDLGFDPIKMPLGAKLKAAMSVLLTWQKEAPEDKIIVYIRWTRSAKALGCVLEKMAFPFVYYNRMATKLQKTRAMHTFLNNPSTKILIASMKCGGQSFNLQVANRVIIFDEWWNDAVEEQAFRRVHRTGQTKETHLVRIMATKSIDERIILLQETKREIIAAALQDGELVPHFSSELQLRMLFSSKDKASLVEDMEKETRKTNKGKGKSKAVKE